MAVSVIIPSYNGAKKLLNILAALEVQTYKDFEVIVVLDGSTDNSLQVLQSRQWQFDLKIVEQENKGRSATRNKGVVNAQNELLIFFDDDMRPLPACISQHVQHHSQFPGSALTGGATEEINDASSEILKYKAFLSSKWLAELKNATLEPLKREQIFATTQNFSLSKTTFNTIGGFDERLTDAEDYDLAIRAHKLHIPLYYNYNVFAWHDDPLTAKGYVKRQRQYQYGQVKLLAVHPEYIQQGFVKTPYKPAGIKSIIFKLFCFRFWIDAIENNSLSWLPTGLKYRIYDYTITANGVFYPEIVNL